MNYKDKKIILFDGVCNLCNTSIQFILKRDKGKKFHFASLQSDVGQEILLQFYDKKIIQSIDSIIFIENNKASYKSSAILRIAKRMGFPYNLSYFFILFPEFIRDFIYDFIAKNRYKWFGKKDKCMIPTAEIKKYFID